MILNVDDDLAQLITLGHAQEVITLEPSQSAEERCSEEGAWTFSLCEPWTPTFAPLPASRWIQANGRRLAELDFIKEDAIDAGVWAFKNAEREVVHQFHADLRLATGFCSQKALAGKSEIGV